MNKKKNKQLNYKERCKIEGFLSEKMSIRNIAINLERGKSTISEEVNKNGGKNNYNADRAHRRKKLRRYRAKRHCNKIAIDYHLQCFIEKGLYSGNSPETISSALKKQPGLRYASAKSIRKFIDKRPGMERLLFWERNNKKSGRKKKKIKEKIDDRKFIEERSDEANYCYGHWEGDFIVSRNNSYCVLVLVEILTRFVLFKKIPNRKNSLVNEAISDMLKNYTVNSLTLDNDIAFQKHEQLEKMINAPVYFCHPYCSWEKGLVENINRWLRIYIPKKSNIALVLDYELLEMENWFNYNPRQCLQGSSSYEKMMKYQNNIILTTLFYKLPQVSGLRGR